MQEKDIDAALATALEAIEATSSGDELEQTRIRLLGRQGQITLMLKELRSVPSESRPLIGKKLNEVKKAIASAIKAKGQGLQGAAPTKKGPQIDVTLPGSRRPVGRRHPIAQTVEHIRTVFSSLGFEIAYGPEIETEHHNFDALNIPPDHPSRDGFDTFYLDDGSLLRSQTSTVQIRVMEERQPPLRIIAPGRVYRPDSVDATHHYMFHQVEGLVVEENVTFADLKYVLEAAIQGLFGTSRKMRLVPSFFPFTEPSAEVYMSCPFCKTGCTVCSQTGWLEIAGCGMVDPNVFEAVGYPSGKYRGFAFGAGIDRIAMLRYGIKDIRLLTENDQDFLHQF